MALSKTALEQFKNIYLEEFKVTLTDDELPIVASRVLKFFEAIVIEILQDGKVKNLVQKGGVLNDNKNKSN